MSLGELAGYAFLAAFALLCLFGGIATRRDLRDPPREPSRDHHRPARAYDRGEVIKP